MAAYIELENNFADESKRTLKLGPFDTDAAVVHSMAVKANVAAVNAAAADIADIYVSEGGASFTGVGAATIVISEEREINLNGGE